MKRVAVSLTDEDFNAFYAAYPDHGARTAILRRVVQRLIKRARGTTDLPATTTGLTALADELINDTRERRQL